MSDTCAHVFADRGTSDFNDVVFAFERCERCGAVLVRCDEPLETDAELENLFDEALSTRDELATYKRLEQRFALLAFDPAWPALVVLLPLEEPVRILSTARSDEAHARLSDSSAHHGSACARRSTRAT